MRRNSLTERDGTLQMPAPPTAVAYFNRTRPVAIDCYLHREKSDGFFLVMVAATVIGSAILLALD